MYRVLIQFTKFAQESKKVISNEEKWRKFNIKACHSSSVSLPKVMENFLHYTGGQVDLLQDDNSGIATICLNHPEKKNAITGEMMVQLSQIINKLEKWKTGKALILHSTGNFFCSGGDLNTVKYISNSEAGMQMSSLMHDTLFRLSMLPLISVAVVQGKALGGGAELTLACDFRLLTENATLQFVQVKMGTATGWSGGTRLVHLLGSTKALKLLLSCKKLTAKEALEISLADDIINETEDPVEQAKTWLKPYLHGETEVIQAMKSIVAHAAWFPAEISFAKERTIFSSIWGGPANIKAVKENVKHR